MESLGEISRAVFMWKLIPSRMANLKVKVESGIAENSVDMIPIEVMILSRMQALAVIWKIMDLN